MNNGEEVKDQSGGVNITGGTVSVGGDIVGRDKVVYSQQQISEVFRPLTEAVRAAPPEMQQEASQIVEELKAEAAKGKGANDGVMAKRVEGIVGLVPTAVSAVVSAFGTPILGGVAGPVTKYVLDKLQGK